MKKTKILIISDHALTQSGVATQSKHLIEGLINTGRYKIVQLGACLDEKIDLFENKLSEDFRIIPCRGYGNKLIINNLLEKENPDAMIIFTDPRYFSHVFEMSETIQKKCPILYWHVWDNRPTPRFNKEIYSKMSHIACISKLTYDMCKEIGMKNISYIPHSLPKNMFYKLDEDKVQKYKINTLGENRKNHFVGLWLNRNIKRKRPADVLKSWQMFLFNLFEKYKHKNATLVMHTNPFDKQGSNLLEIANHLNITENVCFSHEVSTFEQINALHNISDFAINISYSEGFGLSTLESMQTGKPIVTHATGGLTTQIINQQNLNHNGILIPTKVRVLSGNQNVPYLYEDFVCPIDVSHSIMKMYELGKEKREQIGNDNIQYVQNNFCFNNMINSWDNIIQQNIVKQK